MGRHINNTDFRYDLVFCNPDSQIDANFLIANSIDGDYVSLVVDQEGKLTRNVHFTNNMHDMNGEKYLYHLTARLDEEQRKEFFYLSLVKIL